jgi:hypothetical protein
MAFTFKLVTIDGAPADPAQFTTVAPQWRPGNTIPLGPGRALRVVGNRVTDEDQTHVLIVEDAPRRHTSWVRDGPGDGKRDGVRLAALGLALACICRGCCLWCGYA